MATLQGLTIEIGANTTSFSKAMKDIEAEARGISKDLKIVDDTLKLNSQNAEAAAAKLKLLQDAYKNAAQKVETIQEAIEKLNEAYSNKSSAEYRNQLKKLEDQLQTATLEQDRALEKVVAFKDAAEDAGEETSRLGDIIKGNLISSAITKGLSSLVNILKSAAGLAVQAVKSVGNFIGESIELGKRVEETKSKVAAVFGEQGQKQMEQWASNAAHDFHLTSSEAMAAAASFGNIMTGMGMASDAALKYSEDLVLVAAAQADFNDIPTAEVLQKIQSALAGNYEGLLSLGIVIKEADVSERALLNTGKERIEQLTEQEKEEARIQLMYEGSGYAMQKYSENTGSLTSMQAELGKRFDEVKEKIAEKLLPVATDLFKKIIDFVNTEEFSDLLTTLYDSIGDIADAAINFLNSDQLANGIQWLKEQLPTLGEKITTIATSISEVITKAWEAIEALKEFGSIFTDRGGEDLESWMAQGRHYGGGGGWIGNRASGGSVRAGQMYRVNDDAGHRVEMFVPGVNGYILNGNQTQSIVNNNQRTSGDINVYVTSYGTDASSIADEIGVAVNKKLRMSGAMI